MLPAVDGVEEPGDLVLAEHRQEAFAVCDRWE